MLFTAMRLIDNQSVSLIARSNQAVFNHKILGFPNLPHDRSGY